MKKSTTIVIMALIGLLGTYTIQADDIGCPVCLEDYTKDSLVIQLDCDQPVNHHMCVSCANGIISHGQSCPVCRAHFAVHDPRITATTIHHLYRPLNHHEQTQLTTVLRQAPLSQKASPDAIFTECQGCKREHDGLLLRFTCTHAFCIDEARRLAHSGQRHCPSCNDLLTLVDPVFQEQGYVELMYQNRIARSTEQVAIEHIRSAFPLYQAHIPAHKRLPVGQRSQGSVPEAPRPIERPEDLPIVAGLFPDRALTEHEISLTDTYLPAHLSKTVWQVIVQPDGSYARARRARELDSWSTAPTKNVVKDILGNDFPLGAACGLLIAPEFYKKGSFITRLACIPAFIYSGQRLYTTYEKDPETGIKNFMKWGAGLLSMLFTYSWKQQKAEAVV